MSERPNILFLFADQMHAFAMGVYGDGGYPYAEFGQVGAGGGFVSQLLFQCAGLHAVSRDAGVWAIRVADGYASQWAVYSPRGRAPWPAHSMTRGIGRVGWASAFGRDGQCVGAA